MEVSENGTPTMPSVLFREIHKNGVLKKYFSEKKSGFQRKSERLWAVFCIHDDTEAFLEFYTEPKSATTHKPTSFVPLRTAMHISPAICGHPDDFEFAITLTTQVRLLLPIYPFTLHFSLSASVHHHTSFSGPGS